jgi:hypothetical protein
VHLGIALAGLVLVELGAAISVASTTVPASSSRPLLRSTSLTVSRICDASLCSRSCSFREHLPGGLLLMALLVVQALIGFVIDASLQQRKAAG